MCLNVPVERNDPGTSLLPRLGATSSQLYGEGLLPRQQTSWVKHPHTTRTPHHRLVVLRAVDDSFRGLSSGDSNTTRLRRLWTRIANVHAFSLCLSHDAMRCYCEDDAEEPKAKEFLVLGFSHPGALKPQNLKLPVHPKHHKPEP